MRERRYILEYLALARLPIRPQTLRAYLQLQHQQLRSPISTKSNHDGGMGQHHYVRHYPSAFSKYLVGLIDARLLLPEIFRNGSTRGCCLGSLEEGAMKAMRPNFLPALSSFILYPSRSASHSEHKPNTPRLPLDQQQWLVVRRPSAAAPPNRNEH